MKQFRVEVSDGASYRLDAYGYQDAAAKLLCEPGKYPLPTRGVVGIEGPRGGTRFFLKREDCRNLFPISAKVAAFEAAMP